MKWKERSREEVLEWLAREREERIRELRKKLREWPGREEERVLEIGCGHGHWLAAYGERHPAKGCVGVDIRSRRIRLAKEKVRKRNLGNVLFLRAEARELLEATPEGLGWDRVCLLFPDPWPKAKHHKKRLVGPEFLNGLHRKTRPGARVYFRTDHRPYFDWTVEHLNGSAGWEIDPNGEWLFEHESYFQEMMGDWNSLVARRRE